MAVDGMMYLQPGDLGATPDPADYELSLIRTILRYQLDSNDAAILLEAQRAGIGTVASLDGDWARASADFDVYTWL